jgi:hypothetical protein
VQPVEFRVQPVEIPAQPVEFRVQHDAFLANQFIQNPVRNPNVNLICYYANNLSMRNCRINAVSTIYMIHDNFDPRIRNVCQVCKHVLIQDNLALNCIEGIYIY